MPIGFFKRLLSKDAPKDVSKHQSKNKTKGADKEANPKQHRGPNTKVKGPIKKVASAKKDTPAQKPKAPWDPASFKVEPEEGKTRFHDLNLDPRVMQAIQDLGFSFASPIQAESLPITLAGHDIIGKAQTGTGKTAAFLITVLQKLLTTTPAERFSSEPRALVLAPTRELAMQIASDARVLCKHTELNVVTVVGGVDYDKQRDQLQNGIVDILVATPGRLLDFLQQKVVFLDQVEMLVIDEADRMLDMGFIPDLKRIIRATPDKSTRQTQLFSATYPYDVVELSESWTHKPRQVEIEPESVATDTVDQKFYSLQVTEKDQVLVNMLNQPDVNKAIIFGNRRDTTRDLADRLNRMGIKAMLLSGEVAQQKRVKTLERFKAQDNTVLVATDVAGRGIHVDGITHVFNYNLPDDPEDYVHRIGRTGRAGSKGTAITFIDEFEAYGMMDLEAYLNKKVVTEPAPDFSK
jgi:ATP-dependent RNA helicase RhlB